MVRAIDLESRSGSVSDALVAHDRSRLHDPGSIIWCTGLSGSGKTTLSLILRDRLRRLGFKVEILDGDLVRDALGKELGFTKADRDENVRRIAYVAGLLSRNGVIVIVAAISPYKEVRNEIRLQSLAFTEVYVTCPLEVLISRDVKGLYKKALNGEIQHFTGISAPYEPPDHPDVTVDSSREAPGESAARVLHALVASSLIRLEGFPVGSSASPLDGDLSRSAPQLIADS